MSDHQPLAPEPVDLTDEAVFDPETQGAYDYPQNPRADVGLSNPTHAGVDGEDSVRVPASLYTNEPTSGEPVPGTIEVDKPVTQPDHPVIMPAEDTLGLHRAARARALGEVDPGADVVEAPPRLGVPSTYRGWPSFALFLFRLLVAAILSTRATQEIIDFSVTQQAWSSSILPNADIAAALQICLQYLVAVMLVLGLGTRLAGVILMAMFITILSFLIWGAENPFQSGVAGFAGEFELLMTGVGLLFAGIGGGAAAVDGAIHKGHLERKNAKLAGTTPAA